MTQATDLRENSMMAHLMDALSEKKDIGERGRLVFAMVSRHFMEEDEVVGYLKKDPTMDETKARALVEQVKDRGYSPPRREKILEWQGEQDFPICPDAEDPDACNVYKDLQFPEEVYEDIAEYRERKAESER